MASLSSSTSPAMQSFILDQPLILPPLGETANFDDPPNQIAHNIIIITVILSLSAFFFLVRLYASVAVDRALRIEDWIGGIGLLFFFAEEAICTAAVNEAGIGIDQWNLPLRKFSNGLYFANIVEILYSISLTGVKLSILLQYQRLFAPQKSGNSTTRTVIRLCMVLVVLWNSIQTILFIVACIPREQIWDIFASGGHCIDTVALIQAGGIWNVFIDFGLLFLPMRLVWKLQMHERHKFRLSAIFAVGLLGCAASIIRCWFSWALASSENFSVNLFWVGVSSTLEVGSGFIVSGFPFLPKAFKDICARFTDKGWHMSTWTYFLSWRGITTRKPSVVDNTDYLPYRGTQSANSVEKQSSLEEKDDLILSNSNQDLDRVVSRRGSDESAWQEGSVSALPKLPAPTWLRRPSDDSLFGGTGSIMRTTSIRIDIDPRNPSGDELV